MLPISEFWEHASEDFQAQVFLIPEAISASLDDANLVVQALDESQGHLVVGMAIGHDAVPMSLDHGGKFFVGFLIVAT